METQNRRTQKPKKPSNPLVGSQVKSTVLDKTIKADTDLDKTIIDELLLGKNVDMQSLDWFTTISNSREQIYQLLDTMGKDSAVSMLLKTYAESVCEFADNGHIV